MKYLDDYHPDIDINLAEEFIMSMTYDFYKDIIRIFNICTFEIAMKSIICRYNNEYMCTIIFDHDNVVIYDKYMILIRYQFELPNCFDLVYSKIKELLWTNYSLVFITE